MEGEEERSRIRAVQMENLRNMLGIMRMDKILNAQLRNLCRMTKGVDKKIGEGVLRWFDQVENLESDRIAKRVYVGECVGSSSVGRLWKRWIDTVNDCLKKRGLDVKQAENGA